MLPAESSVEPMAVTESVREAQRWQALGLLFFAQMVAIGSISYGFAVLLKPLSLDFGLPRATVNLGLMTLLIGMAVFGPLVGRTLDRVSGRLVVSCGALLFAAGWVTIAASNQVMTALLAAFFLLAPGAAALGPITASTLVSRWFTRKRGLAIGIASVAMSTGGVVVVPILAILIDAAGWRYAMTSFAVTTSAVIFGLVWILLPADVRTPTSEADAVPASRRFSSVLVQKDFWLIAFAIGAVMATNGALLSCLIAYATDRGFSLAQGTALVSAISGTAVAGKLGLGALADRIDPRWLFLAVVALNICLFAALIAMPAYPFLLAAVIFSGPAVGGVMPLWAMIVGRRFGVLALGGAMGLMSAVMLPLNLLGLHIVGSAFDATGSYTPAFEQFLLVLAFAAAAILPVRAANGK
ncbi:hypothetical protein MB02_10745 [Croceicoccus estronivorus]|uniref:MFS transporter n=1 Tax=Croceicoccus estronivorus TaxID=1172626 RepID=UPI000832876B|nr:MFS transporter [Croceicoccus estronivorus]OCC23638.1 hypothetical protein MB02_10745 [Croceicoccus estronivorus]